MNGKRRCENNEYVNIVKAEFRKTEDPVMPDRPDNFEPGHTSFDTSVNYEGHAQKRTSGIESPSCGSTIREGGGGEELLTSNHKSIRICFPYSP